MAPSSQVAIVTEGPIPLWMWIMLTLCCVWATATDLRSMKIPNYLTFPLFLGGLGYATTISGWEGTKASLAGAAFAGGVFVLAYAIAGGGAGDAKLMLALGAWLGIAKAATLVLAVTICGVVWSISVMIKQGFIREVPMMIVHGIFMTRYEFSRKIGRGLRSLIRSASGSTAEPEPPKETSAPVERPKHWVPYAPAILSGLLATWWWTVR